MVSFGPYSSCRHRVGNYDAWRLTLPFFSKFFFKNFAVIKKGFNFALAKATTP